MAKKTSIRTWPTPLTIGPFLLMSGTGVLMFFELELGLMTVIHQWFSWFFLTGAVGHIVANVKPFKNHLKARWGRDSVAVFTLVFVASAFSWGQITDPQLERPIELALVNDPLSGSAAIVKQTPDELLAKLAVHSVNAAAHQSIGELARSGNTDENRLLALILEVDD